MARVYEPFLQNILVASLLAIATSKVNIYIESKLKSSFISSIILTSLLGFLFFIPLLYFLSSFIIYLNSVDKTILKTFDYARDLVKNIPDTLNFLKPPLQEFLNSLNIAELVKKSLKFTATLGKMSLTFLTDISLILIFYLFANMYGKSIIFYIKSILPISEVDLDDIFLTISNVMGVVFYSTIVTAMLQGVLFAIVIEYIGLDGVVLGILYGFASLIPVVGGLIMWLPISIYEIAHNEILNAIIVAIYSIVIISIIADTFIKPWIIKYISQNILRVKKRINELLIFFSIVAGLTTFGFWGIIIGPAVTSMFISILKLSQNRKN